MGTLAYAMVARHTALPPNGTAITELSTEVSHHVEFEQCGKSALLQGLLIKFHKSLEKRLPGREDDLVRCSHGHVNDVAGSEGVPVAIADRTAALLLAR